MHISFYDTTEISQTETILLRKDLEPCRILLLHTATVKLRTSLWICCNKVHGHSWQRLEGGWPDAGKPRSAGGLWGQKDQSSHTYAGSLPLCDHPFGYFCFLGSTTTNSQRLSIYLKRQLQPSPRAKWLTKADTKGAVLPTHLGKTRSELLPTLGGGGGAVLWIQQREKGGGSEGMWPTEPLTHSFQVPSHSSRLWSRALPVPTSGVRTKHTILSIFAGCVLIHPNVLRPKIYTAAIPTFIYFMNDKGFYSFTLSLLLTSATRNLFC